MFFKAAVVAAAVGSVAAQGRPENTSICDYYTTALLKNNTNANQKTLLTLVVNTAVIGNYTQPNMNAVPGILAAGEYNGTAVNLLPYFDGGLASSNRGGNAGMSVNFLDGGGAKPLMNNTAADDMTSNQYMLLTHLYEYFGALLGCSTYGMEGWTYDGESSMYEVHKFMDLSAAEFGYFVQQVALSAQSFGVASSDIMVVGSALQNAFGFKDSPPMAVVTKDEQLQAMCIGEGCPESPKAVTTGYSSFGEPATAVSSLVPAMSSATGTATPAMTATTTGGSGSETSMASGTGGGAATPTPSNTTNSASVMGFSFAAVVAGVVAFFL